MKWVPALLSLGFVVVAALPALALQVQPVNPDRRVFDPRQGESVSIRYRIDAPASVVLQIWDGRDLEIRRLSSQEELSAGEHAFRWDGKDSQGRVVPSEAYTYTVTASDASGASVVHDLSDVTGWEKLGPLEADWSPDEGSLAFLLPEAGRVSVRIGLAGAGPLVRTLLDWVARPAGRHVVAWDGLDESGVLNLAEHPKLRLVVHAFSLPANTIFVGPLVDEVELADLPPDTPRRESERKRRRRTFADQKIDERRDVEIRLTLPDETPLASDGVPLVDGPVPIRLDVVDAEERERMLAERFEVAFYVDGIYEFENEVGFLPTSWRWDPKSLPGGEHFITGNLLGYEGHFGIATLKVRVRNAAK